VYAVEVWLLYLPNIAFWLGILSFEASFHNINNKLSWVHIQKSQKPQKVGFISVPVVEVME
jgi:hypothetical protein